MLWCGDHSASFVLHVNVHHFVIAPARNAKKLQPCFFYINLSMLNCTKVKVFDKKCVWTLVTRNYMNCIYSRILRLDYQGYKTPNGSTPQNNIAQNSRDSLESQIIKMAAGMQHVYSHFSIQHLQTAKPYVIVYKLWKVTNVQNVAKQCKIDEYLWTAIREINRDVPRATWW